MAFEEIDAAKATASAHTGAAVALLKMRDTTPAKLRLMLKPETMEKMGFIAADHAFTALIGTAEHHGLLRLRRAPSGAFRLSPRSGGRGGAWFEVSLGNQPAFVDRAEKAQPCQWERIAARRRARGE